MQACVCVCVRARVCVSACARVCVSAFARACASAQVCVYLSWLLIIGPSARASLNALSCACACGRHPAYALYNNVEL